MPLVVAPPVGLLICVAVFLCLFSADVGAKTTQPVVFYSKMPADWLTTAPGEQEQLSFQLLRMLLQQSEQLAPQFIQVSHSRAERLTQQDPTGCLAGVLDLPERRQQYLFSLPYTAVQGIQLYFKADVPLAAAIQQLTENNSAVSLTQLLLQHRKLLIGVDIDRSYGALLDSVIDDPALKRNIVYRNSGANIGELWQMLLEDRVDVVPEYPFLLPEQVSDDISAVPLAEVPAIQTAYIACNNSPQGQAIISELNKAIVASRFSPVYLQAHLAIVATQLQQQYLLDYRQAMLVEDK